MTWTQLMTAMLPVGMNAPDPAKVSEGAWAIDPLMVTPGDGSDIGPQPATYDYVFNVLHWPNHTPVYQSYVVFNANGSIKGDSNMFVDFLTKTRAILGSKEVMSPQSFYDVAQTIYAFGSSLGGWQEQIESWLPGIATPDADLQGDSAAALRGLLNGIAAEISVLGDDMGVEGGSNELARVINAAGDALSNALTTLANDFETWAGAGSRNSPFDVLHDTFVSDVHAEADGTNWSNWLDWHEPKGFEDPGPPKRLAMKTSLDGTWVGKSDNHDNPGEFATALDKRAKARWTERLVTLDRFATKFATSVEAAFAPVTTALKVDIKTNPALNGGPGPGAPGPGAPGPGPQVNIDDWLKNMFGPGPGPGPGPQVTGPGPGAYGPGPGAYGPGPGAYGPGPGAYGPGPGAFGPGPEVAGPGPGAFGPGPEVAGPGPGPGAYGPGPGAKGPGPGSGNLPGVDDLLKQNPPGGPGPGSTDDGGLGNPSIVPGPGFGPGFGPGLGTPNTVSRNTTGPGGGLDGGLGDPSVAGPGPGSGNLPGVDDLLANNPSSYGAGPGGGLGGGAPSTRNGLGVPTVSGAGGPGPGFGPGTTDSGSLVRPLLGPDGEALRTPSGDIRTVPDGASVTPDGQVLGADGKPLTGLDGKPETAPPGSSLGTPEVVGGGTGGLDLTSGGDTGGLDDWLGSPTTDSTSHLGGGVTPHAPIQNPRDDSLGNPLVNAGSPGVAHAGSPGPTIPSLDDFEHRAAALADTDRPSFGGPGPGSTHGPGGGLGSPEINSGNSSGYGPGGSYGPGPGSYGPGPGAHGGSGPDLFTGQGADTSGTPTGGTSDLTFGGDGTGGASGGAGGGDSTGSTPHSTPYGPGPGMGMGPGPGTGGSGGSGARGGTGAPISSRSITEELSAPTTGRAGNSGQSGMPMMPMSGGPGPGGKDDKRRTSSTVVTEDDEEVWSSVSEETGRSLGR